jgi:hypothetical protein
MKAIATHDAMLEIQLWPQRNEHIMSISWNLRPQWRSASSSGHDGVFVVSLADLWADGWDSDRSTSLHKLA